MDIATLDQSQRLQLINLFRASRELDESDEEKSDFDALKKLQKGEGTLDDSECQMLMVVVANSPEVSDREFRRYKDALIR